MYKYYISYIANIYFPDEYNYILQLLDLYNIPYIIVNGNIYFGKNDLESQSILLNLDKFLLLNSNELSKLIRRLAWK